MPHRDASSRRHEFLELRAELLERLRQFFRQRDFVEVETPLLLDEVIPELHIEPIPVAGRWLQASPELAMKRLLAEGLPAIYQVSRCFRHGEIGRLHNPEFTMVEWYRTGDDLASGMELLGELCVDLLAGADCKTTAVGEFRAAQRTTYADALASHAGVDAHGATPAELAAAARRLRIEPPVDFPEGDCDEWLNLILAKAVEPKLGAAGPEILYEYPATQAALAKTRTNGEGVTVAERFELYLRGVELANGYHELLDAAALRERLETVNRQRTADRRPALPLPEKFLAAHEAGLPDCCGCALGFDRLAMLASGAESIADVMAFTWND